MFLGRGKRGYDRHDQQTASGPFLVVACSDEKPAGGHRELRAFVRTVHLRQCGHFMMGSVKIAGMTVPLSGGMGSDGLPKDQAQVPWDRMVKVPDEIAKAYWTTDDGHNAVGCTASLFVDWALANEKLLRAVGTRRAK